MKLGEIIPEGCVLDDLKSTLKEDVIQELVAALVAVGKIPAESQAQVVKKLMDRESLGSTGIGAGVAVPHAPHDCKLVAVLGRSKNGIDFGALDGQPVHVFFLLLSSAHDAEAHLNALAHLSHLVRGEKWVKSLLSAKGTKELRALVDGEEAAD